MRKKCFTLLEILTCLILITLGAFPLIHNSYKLTQESLQALHKIEMQQTVDAELLFWKEYVYQNQLVPKSLEKNRAIGNAPYLIHFSSKKEVHLLELPEEKTTLFQLEIKIKKGHKNIFSKTYPILVELR